VINYSSIQTKPFELLVYCSPADIKMFTNLFKCKTFISEFFRFINIPLDRHVMNSVFAFRHYRKIGNSIIKFISIFMMNNLVAVKFTAKMLFHNITMLKNLNAINSCSSIPVVINICSSAIIIVTNFTAKFNNTFSGCRLFNNFAAFFACNIYPVSTIKTTTAIRAKKVVGFFNLIRMPFKRLVTHFAIYCNHAFSVPQQETNSKNEIRGAV